MKFGIKTLDDFEFTNKTVLLRVDINEPVNKETGTLTDITRIKACIPTIKELSEKGARVVIMAHQGSDIEYQNFYSTLPHQKILEELLGKPVKFIDDVCGPAAREAIKALKPSEILLLDNVRYLGEEQTLFEINLKLSHEQMAETLLVKMLAPLGDVYINDAFAAAHRDQPSLCGFQQILPSGMGRLFQEEYGVLAELMEQPKHPCIFVLGGAKIADAFLMIDAVLKNQSADLILTGGLVAQVLLWAKGTQIGEINKEFLIKKGFDKLLDNAKNLLANYSDKILLPTDLAYVKDGVRHEVSVKKLPIEESILDIGSETAKRYQAEILGGSTVFVNGPMGVFEETPTETGTKMIWDALGETKGYTVIGGGDSITATNKYKKEQSIDYICTAGGALIRFMTGEELPVVKALKHGAKNS